MTQVYQFPQKSKPRILTPIMTQIIDEENNIVQLSLHMMITEQECIRKLGHIAEIISKAIEREFE